MTKKLIKEQIGDSSKGSPINSELAIKGATTFQVIFPKEWNIPSYVVKNINLPAAYYDEFARRYLWENMAIDLYDRYLPSVSKAIYSVLINKKDSQENQKIILNVLDPSGEISKNWEITIKRILEVSFGHLGHESHKQLLCDEKTNIEHYKLIHMTIGVINCELIS